MKLYTIGFSQKSAQTFFELLKQNGVKTLVDARLNNRSQLAGFTKVKDLPYLLETIGGIGYRHETLLAPTKALLDGYKKGEINWESYEMIYNDLLERRETSKHIDIEDFDSACLLCSEPEADHCHRRLAAEYLQQKFPNKKIEIIHL